MEETDKAYIAGIIDGEGSIGLWKNHQGLRRGCKTPTFALRVRVKMTTELVIRYLHSVCGGRFYTPYKTNKINYKPIYEWSIVGFEADKLLKLIYPYLKLKRPQAELAFEFAKTLKDKKGYKVRLPEEIVQKREILRNQMVILNKRGLN